MSDVQKKEAAYTFRALLARATLLEDKAETYRWLIERLSEVASGETRMEVMGAPGTAEGALRTITRAAVTDVIADLEEIETRLRAQLDRLRDSIVTFKAIRSKDTKPKAKSKERED